MNLYNTDDANINDFLYCTQELGERVSKVVLGFNFKADEFNKIIKKFGKKDINSLLEILPDIEGNMVNEKNLIEISDKFFVSYTHVDKTLPVGFIANVIIYYKICDIELINTFLEELNPAMEDAEDETSENNNNSFYITNSQNGLAIQSLKPMVYDIDNFEMYYNDDTIKSIKKLIKKVNKSNKGISIIHGKRGCGKTTLLSYLTTQLKKQSIFIPVSMIDIAINAGNIKSLIGENSVLIIDDCEILNADMYAKSSLIFGNLLQLIDGLYSDEFNLNIILSFNAEMEDDIEEELLDSNNLLNIIKIEELKKSKAKSLCSLLKLKNNIEESTLLIDIITNRLDEKSETIGY
jgi:energy-coupling factor transporter ATP-binding protein EcfA2